MTRTRALAALAVLGLAPALLPPVLAFGKNKVTYDKFDWKVYASPHFDVHYYPEEEIILEDLVSEAESAYLEISRFFDHEVSYRIPLIVYKTHAEFEQTNVSLSEIPEAVGAFAEPFQNRMVLPADDPPDKRYTLIRHELTHIFEFDIFYGGSLRRTLRASPPLWLMEGLASYVGDDEDSFDQMVIRDAVVHNVVPGVKDLDVLSFLTYRFGHAIFDFIEGRFGREGVRNFLFEYRKALLARDVEKAVRDTFGWDVDQFDRNFHHYLRRKYLPTLVDKFSPDDYGKEIGLKKPGRFTFSPTLSPSGELVAALSTPGLELDVVVLSAAEGKLLRNLTKGLTNDYEYVITEAFSGQNDLSWSPASDRLAFFVRKENRRYLVIYDVLKGRRVAFLDPQVDQPAAPAFAPDGGSILYAGNRGGIVDIYRLDLETGDVANVTRDDYYDTNPAWSADGGQILYNRRVGEHDKIYAVDPANSSRKTAFTTGPSHDIQPAFSRDGSQVFFSSDRGGGIFNLHVLDLDTGDVRRITDLVGGAFSPLEMSPSSDGDRRLAFAAYYTGTFRLYAMDLPPKGKEDAGPALAAPPGPREPAPEEAEGGEDRGPAGGTPAAAGEEGGPAAGEGGVPAADAPGKAGEKTAEEEPAPEEEAEPFRPPLRLTLDEEQKRDYKLVWSVDSPSLAVGVADDGTIFSAVNINFSDLLGDHRVSVNAVSVDTFSNTDVRYLNLKNRYNWGGRLIDYRDFYFIGDASGFDREQGSRLTGLAGLFEYPFNRYYRVNLSGGVFDRSLDFLDIDPSGRLVIETFSDSLAQTGFSFSGDTVRFQEWGPYHGKRFEIGPSYYKFLSGDSEGSILQYSLDFRAYGRLTRRSLVALRVAGIFQDPDSDSVPFVYSVGGINQIRGYRFREFFGNNVAFANLELRFPLLDSFRFPFGLELGPIRGFWFFDVGSAWFNDGRAFCAAFDEDPLSPTFGTCLEVSDADRFYDSDSGLYEPFDFYDSERSRLKHGKASTGLGFNFFFGGLELNWVFARLYDLDELQGWSSDFYITYEF